MKVSLNWLRDYADFTGDIHEYCERMTMSGTKVEGYEVLGDDVSNIVAGKILSTERHPDSDHLIVCQIDAGQERTLQIVTGAQNVKAGDLVPVCLNGAHLPGGKVIKTGKLRGVLSEGMLCSLGELGLDLHDFPYAVEDGIFLMNEECKPGDDIRDVLKLRDTIVDFELTFNRPDCLAYLGIARETAATFSTPLRYKYPEVAPKNNGEKASDYISVRVENATLCPRYVARVVKNVKIEPSPLWMRSRLRACGIRPINNIVDITNYVMLEYGQPMHSFDYNFIQSKTIVVRNAAEGEKITTLDGNVHELDTSMLCIADGEKPIALAGVMGGENSEITDTTDTVLFESANFNRENIRFTSRAVGLRTDSSKRFEKGLPAYNAMAAIDRACELVELLGCGEVVDGCVDVCNTSIEPSKVRLNVRRVNEILGTSLTEEEMVSILKKLEFGYDGENLIIPAYRNDIINTADVAEEVVRLYGVDKLAGTRFEGNASEGKLTENMKLLRKAENSCVALGFSEIYTYSFISPLLLDKLRLPADDKRRDVIKLINPIGDETSVMRTSALPSMLTCVATNVSRRIMNGKLFENATVYMKNPDGLSDEKKILCLAFYGNENFYDMKGYVQALLDNLNVCGYTFVCEDKNPTYHPGRCANVTVGNKVIAVFGQLHPLVTDAFGIDTAVYTAEIDMSAAASVRKDAVQYVPIPVYPAIERDLALVMDADKQAGDVIVFITRVSGKSLSGVNVFDVYSGKGVPEGKKSIAFRLTYRVPDRTLSDTEVDGFISKLLKKLADEEDIILRS